MTAIYISPSIQDMNPFVIGGSEEYYMNQLADAMIPYLRASGISFARNDPGSSLSRIISRSNTGSYDLHLALHSNTSPDNLRGILQGPDVYYYTMSASGRQAADIFAANLRKIYPDPSLVTVIPTTILAELRKTSAPAILIEVAYHDNDADALWIRDNIDAIGRNLIQSVAQFVDVPFSGESIG